LLSVAAGSFAFRRVFLPVRVSQISRFIYCAAAPDMSFLVVQYVAARITPDIAITADDEIFLSHTLRPLSALIIFAGDISGLSRAARCRFQPAAIDARLVSAIGFGI
jgi:hypothetical protein